MTENEATGNETTTNETGDLAASLRALIASRDVQALEERWVEAIESADSANPPDAGAFSGAADALIEASLGDTADTLLELTVPLYEESDDLEALLELLRRWCIAAPERDEPRERFVERFRARYGPTSIEVVYLELSEVARAADIAGAFQRLDGWMRFREGAHVHHESGWGTGKIKSIDPLMRRVVVDLERRPNHTMDIEAMGSVLQPLDEDHFLTMSYEGGEGLRELRDSDPVRLVETVLLSFQNPMDLKTIKRYLIPAVITARDWTRWWNRTKKLLRESGFFRVGDRAPYRVERVETEISYEEELITQFKSGDWNARRQLARRAFRGKEHTRLVEAAVARLEQVATGDSKQRALEAAFLLDRAPGADRGRLESVLRGCDDPLEVALAVDGADEQVAVVALLPALLEDRWPDAAIAVLERGQDPSRDWVLANAGGELRTAVLARIDAVLDNPRPAPRLFVWAVRKAIDETAGFPVSIDSVTNIEFFHRVLDLFDHLTLRSERDQDPVARETLSGLRALLQHRSKLLFRRVIETVDAKGGRVVYERIRDHTGITKALRIELLDTLVKKKPEVARPIDVPIWEQDVIYVTPSGLSRRQAELRELMEDILPAIFEDIGRAAAFGDLSENAEYKAALEKREQFTNKGEQMRAELDRVSLITPEMLKEGEVTLGSRVTVKDVATGERHEYRILGPWDGTPENGVISYRSPMGRSFLGVKVGETVTAELPSGPQEFQVLEVASALDEGAPSS